MKRVFIILFLFFSFIGLANAEVKDVQFVGGTGGSKILELNLSENSVDTSGVIYDKNASLVYEISYTNNNDVDKKVTDVKLPSTDILLSYDFSDIDKNKIIKPGETVKFQYSIKALENITYSQLKDLNENAQAQLLLSTVVIDNSETTDIIMVVVLLMILSFVFYRFVKDKRVFYGCFILSLVGIGFSKSLLVSADDVEVVNINTGIKYIFSNLAPSCANLDYEGDFCVDWKQYGSRDKVNYLVMTDSKEMSDNYKINDVDFVLQNTYDVSEQQDEDVILGVYKAQVDEESYLFLIGQDGGVIVPKDASYQFTSYDSVNNKSENDFKYVKYADFSKFYSNKTTNMEYMLTGIGTVTPLEKLDLSGFETSNVISMKGMFTGVAENTKNFNIDLSMFDTSSVTDMSYMFWEAAYNSETVDLDLSHFDTSKVTDMSNMFYSFGVWAKEMNLNIYNWNTSNVEKMSYMFYNFNILNDDGVYIDYFKDWDTNKVKDMSYMFSGNLGFLIQYQKLKKDSTFDMTGFDFVNVESLRSIYAVNLGVKVIFDDNFDTSNVKDFSAMFELSYLTEPLDYRIFDLSSAESIAGFFSIYQGDELDVSDLNLNNITNISSLFSSFDGKIIGLNKWDVSKVSNFNSLFNNYAYFDSVDISTWDLSSAENTKSMFRLLHNIDILDLSTLNFENSRDYSYMFMEGNEPYPSIIDISGSDWNEDALVDGMFLNHKGTTIYVKDEKAKAFIEKQAPDCTVLVKE